jgi:hypothetical protein
MLLEVEFLTLTEAAELFPRRKGKPLSRVAMRHRIVNGIDGVRLKATRDGRVWFTTKEWVRDFQAACDRKRLAEPARSKTYLQALANIRRLHGR